MNDKTTDKFKQVSGELKSNNKIVDHLNKLFEYKWCWQIVQANFQPERGTHIIQGRLMLPGIGLKDGIGIGTTFQMAAEMALTDAADKLGLERGANISTTSSAKTTKKPVLTDEQKQELLSAKEDLGIKDNYELSAYIAQYNPDFTSINNFDSSNIDGFIQFLRQQPLPGAEGPAEDLF